MDTFLSGESFSRLFSRPGLWTTTPILVPSTKNGPLGELEMSLIALSQERDWEIMGKGNKTIARKMILIRFMTVGVLVVFTRYNTTPRKSSNTLINN